MKLKLDPTKSLVAILATMSVLVTAFNFSSAVLMHLCATVGFALVLYWAYENFSSKTKSIWNTLITAMIIFLVLNHGGVTVQLQNIIYPMIAVFIAETQKFFVEVKGSPIINPAVTGLLLMAALVSLFGFEPPFISWWGANFEGWVAFSLIGLWMLIGLKKWNKWPMVLTFLFVHAAGMLVIGESEAISFIFRDSTIYFMAAIMLVEPKTSPVLKHQQLLYGAFVAIAYTAALHVSFPYAALVALALGDLGWMMKRVAR